MVKFFKQLWKKSTNNKEPRLDSVVMPAEPVLVEKVKIKVNDRIAGKSPENRIQLEVPYWNKHRKNTITIECPTCNERRQVKFPKPMSGKTIFKDKHGHKTYVSLISEKNIGAVKHNRLIVNLSKGIKSRHKRTIMLNDPLFNKKFEYKIVYNEKDSSGNRKKNILTPYGTALFIHEQFKRNSARFKIHKDPVSFFIQDRENPRSEYCFHSTIMEHDRFGVKVLLSKNNENRPDMIYKGASVRVKIFPRYLKYRQPVVGTSRRQKRLEFIRKARINRHEGRYVVLLFEDENQVLNRHYHNL